MKNLTVNKGKAIVFVLIFGIISAGASAKNFNQDVNKLVKQNLLQDDYAELMPQQSTDDKQTIGIYDVNVDSGLVAQRHADKMYFYRPSVIKIYNLVTESWESDFVLPEAANALSIDNLGLYIAHDRALYFYPFDLSPRIFFGNSQNTIKELIVINDYLIVDDNQYTSYNKTNGSVIEAQGFFYALQGHAAVAGMNKLIGRSTGISPCDIVSLELDINGELIGQSDSTYHGDYPCSSRVYAFPDGSRVIDGAGIIYHASSLLYAGSLAGSLDHAAFYGDLPVILRGDSLYSYSNTMTETGSYTMSENKDVHAVYGETVFAFDYGVSDVEVELIDMNLLTPDTPGVPVDPNGLVYTPDSVQYDGGDKIYLLDMANINVHIFNVNTMSYDVSIPLNEAPLYMAHSKENNKLYFAYNDGRLTQVDLNTNVETSLVNSPQTPCGLASIGDKIFVCDPSGSWVSHFTYSSTGELISQEDWNYYSTEYKWSKTNRKIYHYRDDTSPNDLIWEEIDENGVIGNSQDSPYHRSGWTYPLCVNPDGSDVVIGNGTLFDAITLNETNYLSNNIKGCAWAQGQLYTLDDTTTTTDLQSWSTVYQEQFEEQWNGEPFDLIGLESGALIVIYMDNSIPQFAIHNDIIFSNSME